MLKSTRIIRCLLCLAVTLTFAGGTSARADKVLRFKFQPGEKLQYVMRQVMASKANISATPVTSTVTIVMDMSWEVKSVDADGKASVVMTFDRIRMKMESPQGLALDYDSASEAEPEGMAKMFATFMDAMVNKPMTMKMNARGEVSDVKVPQAMVDQLKRMPGMEQMGGMFSEDGMKHIGQNLSLPKEAVAPGKKWSSEVSMPSPMGGKGKTKVAYQYRGTETRNGRELEKILSIMELDFGAGEGQPIKLKVTEQDSKGVLYFDNQAGRLAEAQTKTKMKMAVEVGEQKMSVDLQMDIRMELVSGGASEEAKPEK